MAARAYTDALLAPIADVDLVRQLSTLQSKLVWDDAHSGHYEELWLVRQVGGGAPADPSLDDVYDAFAHPRADRPSLALLEPARARAFADGVRRRALDALDRLDPTSDHPLHRGGFAAGLVVQHELQHNETMCQTIQLATDLDYSPAHAARPLRVVPQGPAEIDVPAGSFRCGASDPWAYDNELPAHEVHTDAFTIDVTPVTNGQFAAFIEDGGYRSAAHWSVDGQAWRRATGPGALLFWTREDDRWMRRRFGRNEPVPVDE